ncbi:MAG: TonB-dependent receptor [Bacteroidetes bacterium]|nr:TonB-dependent receptor [Bacteroidota bacterium]MBS1650140.1 TonB-dependent receptor [Bacteroidota bacterium]
MKKPLLLNLFVLFYIFSTAQNAIIKGTVTDTLNNQNLKNAVVSLLRGKDSVLYKYVRTNEVGKFELNNLSAGNYILRVSYPNYAVYMDALNVSDTSNITFNQLPLITKAKLLEEVIVKQKISPIRMKGDTLEFLADSFKVKEGANVQDLLKKFPGFTVNSKGEITAQGQQVQKVLVDGDEFFGDDPTLATQNINARDVAKVQVFDKKSDQATLTGIDDGQKQKTLNLVLKEDAKKGYFGKAEAGSDFDKYYQGKITANKFTATSKIGAYVTTDRTGKNDMNWNEMQDFGNVTTVINGNNIMMYGEGDDFSSYGQQGVPENLVSALMYNKKFGKYKNNTTNNYTYKHQNLAGESTTNTQYILPDTVYYNNQSNHFNNTKWMQSFNTRNEFNIDSSNTISVNAKGTWGHSNSYSLFNSAYLSSSMQKVNSSNRTNNSSENKNNQKLDLFYTHKFNKAGTRILTLNATYAANNNNSNGFLYSETDFYKNGMINTTQIVDQKKINTTTSNSIQGLISYTEPITKKVSLNLNYTVNSNASEQDFTTYEKRNGKYDSLNLLYSNHYKFINTFNRGGFSLNYNTKKLNSSIGLAVQDLVLKQTNIYTDSSMQRSFTNFFPTANIRYKYSSSGNISIRYNGRTDQPSLYQLQPIANNTDPLNIVIGNPNLKPSFTHSINFNFGDFKVINKRNIYGYGGFNFMQNSFANKSIVDSLGRTTTQTVNVNSIYNAYFGFNYSKTFRFIDIGIGPNININRNINFINGLENITKSYNVGVNFRVNKEVEKKYDISINYNPNFNYSTSSVNTAAITKYWTHSISSDINYKFLKGFILNSDINANFRQKLNAADNKNNSIVWNASLEKRIIKKKDISLIVSVNDILNQNIGFNRNINSNFISENTYTTVQRYFLFSIRWKFAKNKKVNEDFED